MPGVPIDGPTPDQLTPPPDQAPQAPDRGPMKFGILGRLLGQKHQEELREREREAKFYAENIHSAYFDPNSRVPDNVLTDWGNKLANLVGGGEHGDAIKADVKRQIASRQAGRALAQLNADQKDAPSFGPQPQAPMPQQAAPAPQNFSPAGASVAGVPNPNAAPGLPPPPGPVPFVGGADAGAALPGENPAVKLAATTGGVGFGGPAAAPAPSFAPAILSRAQLGEEQGAQAAALARAEAGMKRQQSTLDYQARKDLFEAQPWYKGLSDRQKAALLTGTNITPEPHFSIPGVALAPEGAIDFNGNPVAAGTPGRWSVMEGRTVFTPEPGRLGKQIVTDAKGNKVAKFVNMYTGEVVPQNQVTADQLTSAPTLRMIKVTTADGTTHEYGVNPVTGKLATDDPRLAGINPAMLTTQTDHIVMVTQPDGSVVPVPVTSTSSKVGGGLPAAPAALPAAPTEGNAPPQAPIPTAPHGGPRGARVGTPGSPIGGRAMTPEQQIKNGQIAEQLNNTIGTIKDLQNKVPMLASMMTAGKIGLQVDPHQGFWRGIVNKNMNLTPEEAQLASDWQLLTEGVMQMRIPMGGAGFRGQEGFGAIQSNKGILSQHPEIIKRVLEGTLREFRAQRQPLVEGAKKYGYSVKPEYEEGYRRNLPAPPEGTPTHGIPELGSTFNGGKVIKVTKIE